MAADPAPISFARGAPSLDIIDVEGLKTAAERAFTDDPAGSFAYGTSVGYLPLRSWIAERHGVTENQVLVTNGSMQADAFLFTTLVQQGDAVIVERPSYDRTLGSLRSLGADLHAVDIEPDGVSVDGVRAVLDSGVTPTLAHLIPNFHSPAGYTLSADKRTQLVALARERGFTIFEDDPTWSCASPVSGCPRCSSSPTARSSTRARSPRRSAPVSGWATSWARPT